MMHELWIADQRVDLGDEPRITLEIQNNLLNEPGKINLSHSYTIKIPRTYQNSRILRVPEHPANLDNKAHQYLRARYYRNGIDILGDMRAYLIKVTPEEYEVALVSTAFSALQALSDSKAKLNDLEGLPILRWIGSSGTRPDYYAASVGFAPYVSGLPDNPYPALNAAEHPYIRLQMLLAIVMGNAGVEYEPPYEGAAPLGLWNTALLAAPGHKPTIQMEQESGVTADAAVFSYGNILDLASPSIGWDWPWVSGQSEYTSFATQGLPFRLFLNLAAPKGADWSNVQVALVSLKELEFGYLDPVGPVARWPFRADADGNYFVRIDEEIEPNAWTHLRIGLFTLDDEKFLPGQVPSRYDSEQPLVMLHRLHETVNIAADNRFPIQGNLPDIGQWEFVKSCCAMLGMVLYVKDGRLRFVPGASILSKGSAVDWSDRLVMESDVPEEISYTLDGWAQSNRITYETDDEDLPLPFDATAVLKVSDSTLKASRDYFKLPYAASNRDAAIHYKVDTEKQEVEDIDIAPRIFQVRTNAAGRVWLEFVESMYGDGLIREYYADLQKVLEKPVKVTATVRMSETDIKTLDLCVPVYFRQFGKYYLVQKLQTSDSDSCKVELIQIP